MLKKIIFLSILILVSVFALNAQNTLTGKVVNRENQEPLGNVTVTVQSEKVGTKTNSDGVFSIETSMATGNLIISSIGYETKTVAFDISKSTDLGIIEMSTLTNELETVVVIGKGITDVAKDRKTPIAVSTVTEKQIVSKLGNQEFPEILKSTPSVFVSKAGGGFGDARMVTRGFDQSNTAVMVNGVPVNDMENGSVYWSNWAGISDVTSFMQVQRGLGSSKLAIASVGGTVNILTRSADMRQGGRVSFGLGNDGYNKGLITYNTGKGKSGWSGSFLFSRTAGAMYADGTDFEGYNYFAAVGYQPNDKHNFQFTITGAPQWHNQRSYEIQIATLQKFGSMDKPNRRFNAQQGILNGDMYPTKVNYYHKPVLSLNWDFTMSPKTELNTVAYASFGRGGGTSDIGSVGGKRLSGFIDPATGYYNLDQLVEANQNAAPGSSVVVRNASVNSHNWYGILSSLNHKINEHWNFSVGMDGRYYYGYHYQVITDLWGAQEYPDATNKNLTGPNNVSAVFAPKPKANPFGGKVEDISDRIGYSNDGEVKWLGLFGQVEYTGEKLSAFLQGSYSNQAYQRIDNFLKDPTEVKSGDEVIAVMHKKTGFKPIDGFNLKTGANLNIDQYNNVFANIGYYSKQPFLNAVYPNNANRLNPYLTNEKIFGMELGYGLRTSFLNANLNLYRTSWKDRNQRVSQQVTSPEGGTISAYGDIRGITEIHQGIEFDATARANSFLSFNGMLSIGDYHYEGNAKGNLYDDANNPIGGEATLYLDKLKVGSTAQLTAGLGFILEPLKRKLTIDGNWLYAANNYSRVNIPEFSNPNNKGTIKLPSYSLFDFGAGYRFDLSKTKRNQNITVRGNIYNLFDTYYISQSYTSYHADDVASGGTQTYQEAGLMYDGIATRNEVFFGYGRTWSISLTYNF